MFLRRCSLCHNITNQSGISSLGFGFIASFPAAGGGGRAVGRGPEGAAGAHADQAEGDPCLRGGEPHRSGEGEQQPQTSPGTNRRISTSQFASFLLFFCTPNMNLRFSRRICPGSGGSWRSRRRWRCTLMQMRSCRRRSTSTRWGEIREQPQTSECLICVTE